MTTNAPANLIGTLSGDYSFDIIRHVYTSVGLNPRSSCCQLLNLKLPDSSQLDILAFGASNAICLAKLQTDFGCDYSLTGFKILRLLNGHHAPVNCLRWLCFASNADSIFCHLILVSLDAAGNGIVWTCNQNSLFELRGDDEWSHLLTFQTHKAMVPNAVDGFCSLDPDDNCSIRLVFDVASDTVVSTWHTTLNLVEEPSGTKNVTILCSTPASVSHIDKKPLLCLCLRSIYWNPNGSGAFHLLIVGMDNGSIEIWSERFLKSANFNPEADKNEKMVFQATVSGHTDWVRCIAVVFGSLNTDVSCFVATGGQDNFVRIWKIQSEDSMERLSVTSESVLAGHSNWVTGVAWAPQLAQSSSCPPPLISASMDKTLIVWAPHHASGNPDLWIEQARLGSVGGSNLGFLDCFYAADASAIYALNFQGNLSSWVLSQGSSVWHTGLPVCGHHGSVTDLSWARVKETPGSHEGSFRLLLTAGSDQTVRAHSPMAISKTDNGAVVNSNAHWIEIARPQIHGYDMNAIACLSSTRYVSAGDEKVGRIFDATPAFIHRYERISGVKMGELESSSGDALVEGVVQPTLGLSNQVVSAAREDLASSDTQRYEAELSSVGDSIPVLPPSEDFLQHSTLWPEAKKLYGHPYEVYALAAHPQIPLVASSCVASKQSHAFIIIWDGWNDWAIHQRLIHHQLTVTQMSFCNNGQSLLAVSRDRTWSVWLASAVAEGAHSLPEYRLAAFPLKGHGHSRIIWACAWSPDDRYFFTGSRDKTIMAWSGMDLEISANQSARPLIPLDVRLAFSDGVTALDVCSLTDGRSDFYLLAIGLESGNLILSVLTQTGDRSPSSLHQAASLTFPPRWTHVPNKQVRRVAFEPSRRQYAQASQEPICLATGADDAIVHVFAIDRVELMHYVSSRCPSTV